VDVLFLDRCVVAEFAVEAAAVEQVDVLGDSDLEIVDAFPLATVTDQFGFEERVDNCRSINATIVLQPAAEEPPGPPLLGTQEKLRIAIVTCIERTYHRRRRQARLGRFTPI